MFPSSVQADCVALRMPLCNTQDGHVHAHFCAAGLAWLSCCYSKVAAGSHNQTTLQGALQACCVLTANLCLRITVMQTSRGAPTQGLWVCCLHACECVFVVPLQPWLGRPPSSAAVSCVLWATGVPPSVAAWPTVCWLFGCLNSLSGVDNVTH